MEYLFALGLILIVMIFTVIRRGKQKHNGTWHRETCPQCDRCNWILDDTNYEDSAAIDISDYTCWNCRWEIRMFSGNDFVKYNPHVMGDLPEDQYQAGMHTEGHRKKI